ncbi:MAG: nucleotidyltransferase domain-containing protein [Candidatus Tectomicrobia bacterium]|nr:nucleotidyltransferase domain-containing protein [Candidatus Tectomicrobia bacterium]
MNNKIRTLLRELKVGLQGIYSERLKGVYLYGSYARGENDSESDVDVLVILDRIDHYGAEVDRTGYLVSELSLKYGVSISRIFVSQQDWVGYETPFLTNTREEAILI